MVKLRIKPIIRLLFFFLFFSLILNASQSLTGNSTFHNLYAVGTVKDGWVLNRTQINPDGTATDTWAQTDASTQAVTKNGFLGYSVATLYFSNSPITPTLYALQNKTTAVASDSTKLLVSGTGDYAFHPETQSSTANLPPTFSYGWKSSGLLNFLNITVFTLKIDLTVAGGFTGYAKIRLDKGTSNSPSVSAGSWLSSSPQTFSAGKYQLSQDFSVSPFVLKNEYLFAELAVTVSSFSGAPSSIITLNTNTMKTTAIIIPSTTHKAYYKVLSNQASAATSPDYATLEFSSSYYTAIGSKDGVYAVFSDASARTLAKWGNTATLLTFNTAGYTNNASRTVSDITIEWKGYYLATGDVATTYVLQDWKQSTSTWEAWQTLPTSNTDYNKSLGTGTNYLYSTTWLKFGLYATTVNAGITCTVGAYSDYVAVKITYTEAGAKVWNIITSWAFTLISMIWRSIITWTFTLISRTWNAIITWAFSLIGRTWQTIVTWTFILIGRTWRVIETWTFQFFKAWVIVESWVFTLGSRLWNVIQTWTFTLTARTWRVIESWVFYLIGRAWCTVESWTFQFFKAWIIIETWVFVLTARTWQTIITWTFQFFKAWVVVESWTFSLGAKIWNAIATWTFSLVSRTWRTIDFWLFTLQTMNWNSMVSWTFTLIASWWNIVESWIFTLGSTVFAWQIVESWIFVLSGMTVFSFTFIILGFFFFFLTLGFIGKRRKRKTGIPEEPDEYEIYVTP